MMSIGACSAAMVIDLAETTVPDSTGQPMMRVGCSSVTLKNAEDAVHHQLGLAMYAQALRDRAAPVSVTEAAQARLGGSLMSARALSSAHEEVTQLYRAARAAALAAGLAAVSCRL